MYSKASTVAFLGLAASSLVAAAPYGSGSSGYSSASTMSTKYYGSTTASQAPSTASYSTDLFPTEVSADPFALSNGFPDPNSQQIQDIEVIAGGTIPNGKGGAVSADTLTSLRLIAFNELFEVAFFTSLLQNVTNHIDGYDVSSSTTLNLSEEDLILILSTVQAQEELHLLNANDALVGNGQQPIAACEYQFPTQTLDDAIALAQKFTDVVLGTLQDVIVDLGTNGDAGVARGIASVIGQEGEQNGFYRLFNGLRPSAEPFLTASTREFAFSALNQNFVVTCPYNQTEVVGLPVFRPLNIVTPPVVGENSNVTFSFTIPGPVNTADASELSLVLINGQNVPVVEALGNVRSLGAGVIEFDAPFNFVDDLLFGLAIAVIALSNATLTSVDAVAEATVFGPALIEML